MRKTMNELSSFLENYERASGEPLITTVYLIRHGETMGSEEKRYKGQTDVPLSEEGIIQVEQLAAHMEKEIKKSTTENINMPDSLGGLARSKNGSSGLDVIYTSDLMRSVKSAEIIAKPFGLKPVIVPQLRERNFGHWEGMTFNEIRKEFPEEFDAWANDPLRFGPVGGESTEAVSKRVMPVFYDMIKSHINKKIAIVAHGGPNRIILCNLCSIPLQNIFRIEQDFACMNVIDFYEDMPVLKVMNYTV